MICPLQPIVSGKQGGYHYTSGKERECAWWSKAEGKCSMLLMAAYLGGLVAIGDKLLDKMPHEAQFRK